MFSYIDCSYRLIKNIKYNKLSNERMENSEFIS